MPVNVNIRGNGSLAYGSKFMNDQPVAQQLSQNVTRKVA